MNHKSIDSHLKKFSSAKLGDKVLCPDCNAILTLKEFTGIAFWVHPDDTMEDFLIAMEKEISKNATS